MTKIDGSKRISSSGAGELSGRADATGLRAEEVGWPQDLKPRHSETVRPCERPIPSTNARDQHDERPIALPEALTLRERLARPRQTTQSRIRGWQHQGQRVILSAQFKVGKTVLVGNLIRCLVDGDQWLGRDVVTPLSGTLLLLDFEMAESQLDDWFRDQGIKSDDRVRILPMRGRAATFNILDPRIRTAWATYMRQLGVEYFVFDCVRPILDALNLDEHRDAGRFLTAVDALLLEAGIQECFMVHHMGHVGERSRGDSRFRDWPDVEWRLVRQTAKGKGNEEEEPSAPRFSALTAAMWRSGNLSSTTTADPTPDSCRRLSP
jgi:RecA-family ATPase